MLLLLPAPWTGAIAIASESIPALDESGARLMSDMTLVSSVSINGWQAAAPICLNRTNERLLDPQGKPVDEVGSRPAAILLEYGLSHAIVRDFKKGQRSCELSFLRFKTKQGAFGAYSTMREGSSTVVARGQASSETENSISFYSADCLVLLKCAEDDSEAKAALSQLADKFAPRLPESAASPAILTYLPRYSRLQGSEKLFMGNKSASHYSSFPFIDSLRLDRCTEAVTADYSYARPLAERLHLLLADYGKVETASQCYDAYVQEMTPYLRKTVENAQGEFLGKLHDSYLMCGLRGTRVFVIAGARKAAAPRMLSRELRY